MQVLVLCYADEVAFLISHANPDVVVMEARRCAEDVTRIPGARLGLRLETAKSFYLAPGLFGARLGSPGNLVPGLFRRAGEASRSARSGLSRREGQLATLNRQASGVTRERIDVCPEALKTSLPYAWAGTDKIVGMRFDVRWGFGKQADGILRRAGLRQGIMAILSRCTWVLEAGSLRFTHSALLTSLITYGFVVMGAGAYVEGFLRLGTGAASVTARRITGISRSARLHGLRVAAGVWSVRNLYLQRVAMALQWVLVATERPFSDRLIEWSGETYGVEGGIRTGGAASGTGGLAGRSAHEGNQWEGY